MNIRIADLKNQFGIFLNEAYKTNDSYCGYASMMVICSIIHTISEAEYRYRLNPSGRIEDKILITNFINNMTDFSWLLSNNEIKDKNTTASDCLNQIRNGLAHQLSIPLNTILVKNIEESNEFRDYYGIEYFICIKELINSIKRTMNHIISTTPEALIDINHNDSLGRAIGDQIFGRLPDGTIISGSPAFRG